MLTLVGLLAFLIRKSIKIGLPVFSVILGLLWSNSMLGINQASIDASHAYFVFTTWTICLSPAIVVIAISARWTDYEWTAQRDRMIWEAKALPMTIQQWRGKKATFPSRKAGNESPTIYNSSQQEALVSKEH